MYGTDNGPPCSVCKGTIYEYFVISGEKFIIGPVRITCCGCRKTTIMTFAGEVTAKNLSCAHRGKTE